MAMISEEGAPSLKVLFQVAHIPLDETMAEFDDHGHWETSKFLDS